LGANWRDTFVFFTVMLSFTLRAKDGTLTLRPFTWMWPCETIWRAAARQMVSHGHIQVNGRKVNVPSFSLKVNDNITVKNTNVSRQLATKNLEISTSRAIPDWLTLNKEEFKGVVMRIPSRDEINPIANEQAVVEFYSR